MEAAERTSLAPALMGSALLHAGVALLTVLTWTSMAKAPPPPVVPVQLITEAGEAGPPPIVEAPEPAPATAPEPAPVPQVEPPPPPAPASRPRPAPPAPRPQPSVRPSPVKPQPARPTPAKPQPRPTPSEPDLDLDQLAASVARSRPARPAAPRRGPATPERGPEPRAAAPSRSLSAGDLAGMKSRVERAWTLNCTAAGSANVTIRVQVRLTGSGGLAGRPQILSKGGASPAVVDAAARGVVSAITRAAPFTDVPLDLAAGQDIVLRFSTRDPCRGR